MIFLGFVFRTSELRNALTEMASKLASNFEAQIDEQANKTASLNVILKLVI